MKVEGCLNLKAMALLGLRGLGFKVMAFESATHTSKLSRINLCEWFRAHAGFAVDADSWLQAFMGLKTVDS